MVEFLSDLLEMLIGRTSGPLTFRLIFAPTMASIFAIRAGLKDMKKGQKTYLYSLLTDKSRRMFFFRQGWKDVGKVFIVMSIVDVIYQIIVFQWVYPGQVLIVATFLAIIPYLLVRSLVIPIGKFIYGSPEGGT